MSAECIYVVEHDAPRVKLMVWALRQEGRQVMSAPAPSDAADFAANSPTHVIINCELPAEDCARLVADIRAAAPDVRILDLGEHDVALCRADGHLGPPHNVSDVIAWMDGVARSQSA